MDFQIWLAFAAGVIVICGSPGPNMLQVMSSSARHGMRRSLFTMAGCFSSVFLMISASVVGVGVFIQMFPALFNAIRYAGAAYLMYLGIGAWRARVEHQKEGANNPSVPAADSRSLFWRGFLVGSSNPKAMLFATAFFPQFVNPHAPQALQFAILLGTFSVAEISWYMVYGLGGSRLTRALKQAHIQRRFNRCTGGLFILLGLGLAVKE